MATFTPTNVMSYKQNQILHKELGQDSENCCSLQGLD